MTPTRGGGVEMMKLSWIGSALFILIVGCYGVSLAQEADTAWLVGVWRGTGRAAQYTVDAAVEFKDGGNTWEFEVTSGSNAGSKARGSTKVSGDSMEMKGQYYAGRLMGNLSCSLRRTGNTLDGTCLGSTNMPTRISFGKVK